MVTINLIMLKFKAFAALLSLYVGIYINILHVLHVKNMNMYNLYCIKQATISCSAIQKLTVDSRPVPRTLPGSLRVADDSPHSFVVGEVPTAQEVISLINALERWSKISTLGYPTSSHELTYKA